MTGCKQAKVLGFILVLFLSGCSTTQQAHKQNIMLYFASSQGVTLSNEAVSASPADLIYVKNGERPIATMALAFIENGQYKWISQDNAMIITSQGRLVQTLGFNDNLMHMSNLSQDPLQQGASIDGKSSTWSRRIDTEIGGQGDYGALINSQSQVLTDRSLVVNDIEFSVIQVQESVTYSSVLYGSQEWMNVFVYESKTKQLLQSSQTMAPNMDTLEITYVSRALRLLESKNPGAQ